jgi:hypothetical protein
MIAVVAVVHLRLPVSALVHHALDIFVTYLGQGKKKIVWFGVNLYQSENTK